MGSFVLVILAVVVSQVVNGQADRTPTQEAPKVLKLSDAKRGCTFVVGFRNLSVFYERALVVAKKEVPAGEPDEYWLLFPDREQDKTKEGYLKPVNVPADQVLFLSPKDGPAVVMHRMRICKCPPFFWGASSGVSAEH